MKKLLIILCLAFIAIGVKAQNADTLFKAGNYNAALNIYSKELRIDSNNIVALKRVGYIYSISNAPVFAYQAYEKALRLEPNNGVVNFLYAELIQNNISDVATEKQKLNLMLQVKKHYNISAKAGYEPAIEVLKTLK